MKIDENLSQESADSLLAVCLFAAFCDGVKSGPEHAEVRRLAEELGSQNPAALSQRILMGRIDLDSLVPSLGDPSLCLLAYEMALGVCEADGMLSAAENEFLEKLRLKLGLGAEESAKIEREVASLVLAPVNGQAPLPPAPPESGGMILNYAILTGALELLPDTLASMAIIPLQMKMVYRIGKAHGLELDSSRIKEFLAVAGVGMGSQMLEGFARKFLRGIGKKVGGKLAGRAVDQITGSAFSFAATYALGQLAEKYYAGGRRLDAASARSLFDSLQTQARELHSRHLPEIQTKAQSLDVGSILKMVTGSVPA